MIVWGVREQGPGGNVAQDYHWRWGVGPRDERPTWINLSWKNEPEPSDFGTDEFLQFCRNVGARIKLVGASGRAQYPFVSTATNYQSASDRRVHFGLGADGQVKAIEIRWPSGVVQQLSDVKADQVLKVVEPRTVPEKRTK